MGCGSSRNATFKEISKLNNAPQYYPLNIPVGEIGLPAVLVGNEELPSSGCFSSEVNPSPVPGYEELIQKAERQRNIEASLKAKLEKEFIEMNLESEFRNFLSTSITSKIFGSKVYLVDPSKAGPNFSNERCKIEDLKWYNDNRVVISGAIKADSIIIEFNDSLSNDLKAKLDTVIEKVNTDLKASFSRAVSESGKIQLKGYNLYYAGLTTSLKSSTCKKSIELMYENGQTKTESLCNDEYKLSLTKSGAFDRFSFNFIKLDEGLSTGTYDLKVNELLSVPFGMNRFANIFIENDSQSNTFKVNTSITLVGISGN